ncbi:MAG: hypothetical protein J07HX64_00737 [halophilic archaeon J07HX64]|nr:MAG: hypothetical protein J07HX64_00737 [halophilic archaeon J07HX64]
MRARGGTGEQVWTVDTGDTVESSPSVVGGTVFAGSLDGRLYALDAATGEQVWTVDTGDAVRTSPAVAGATALVAGGVTVYALAAASGGQLWRFEMDSTVVSSPTVADSTVVVGDDRGRVSALDIVSGEHRWTFETGDSVRILADSCRRHRLRRE